MKNNNIGSKIRKIRELKNFTQEYVACKIGVTQSQYSRYENSSVLSLAILEKIAIALEVSVEDIENFEPNIHSLSSALPKTNKIDILEQKFELVIKELNLIKDYVNIHNKELQKNNKQKIDICFEDTYKSKVFLNGKKSYTRYLNIPTIIAKTYLTENEILEVIENSCEYALKTYRSNYDNMVNDMLVVEKTFSNVPYGAYYFRLNCMLWIINPMGATERGVNHFCYTLYDNLFCNYIALTQRIYDSQNKLVDTNYSNYYAEYQTPKSKVIPELLGKFLRDITGIQEGDWVIVLCSAASGRQCDINVEYGAKKYSDENSFENATISDLDTFLQWKKEFLSINNTEVAAFNKGRTKYDFIYKENQIGSADEKWIANCIHRLTKANVITIYINIKLLNGPSEAYYVMLNYLLQSLENSRKFFRETLMK